MAARDAAREALLAVVENRVGQLALRRARDQIGGRVAAASVHAHVERLVALKTEATAGPVELQRRDAEIGERAVDERHAAIVEHGVDRAVIGVHELDAIAPRRERFARASASASASRSRPMTRVAPRFQERARVAAEADRAVDEDAAALGLQMLQHFGGQDRDVAVSNAELRKRARVVVGVRLALQLGEEPIVIPHIEVVVLARARRRRRSSWRTRAGGPG